MIYTKLPFDIDGPEGRNLFSLDMEDTDTMVVTMFSPWYCLYVVPFLVLDSIYDFWKYYSTCFKFTFPLMVPASAFIFIISFIVWPAVPVMWLCPCSWRNVSVSIRGLTLNMKNEGYGDCCIAPNECTVTLYPGAVDDVRSCIFLDKNIDNSEDEVISWNVVFHGKREQVRGASVNTKSDEYRLICDLDESQARFLSELFTEYVKWYAAGHRPRTTVGKAYNTKVQLV